MQRSTWKLSACGTFTSPQKPVLEPLPSDVFEPCQLNVCIHSFASGMKTGRPVHDAPLDVHRALLAGALGDEERHALRRRRRPAVRLRRALGRPKRRVAVRGSGGRAVDRRGRGRSHVVRGGHDLRLCDQAALGLRHPLVDDDRLVGGELERLVHLDALVLERVEIEDDRAAHVLLTPILVLHDQILALACDRPAEGLGLARRVHERVKGDGDRAVVPLEAAIEVHHVDALLVGGDVALVRHDLNVLVHEAVEEQLDRAVVVLDVAVEEVDAQVRVLVAAIRTR